MSIHAGGGRSTGQVLEGGDATFTVEVSGGTRTPSSDLTVSQTGSFVATGNLGSKTVTITGGERSAAYTVTTVDDDSKEANGEVKVALETGSGYRRFGVTSRQLATYTVIDNDTPGRVGLVVPTSVTVTEGDAEYTVRLSTQPSAQVTVAITGHSGTDLTLDPSSARLTFTTSNWNTAQTVTVTAAEDADAANDMATLAHAASGGDYGSATANLAVTVTDDDTAGLVVPTSLTVAEGDDAEYTVRLSTQPTAQVTVAITGHSGTDLTLDPSSARLTFTTSNWNTTQTVTVTAAEDADAANDMATLAHAASGGDYGSVTADLAVTVTDNDTAGLVVPTSLTVAEGDDAEYTVRLSTQPTAQVTVAITGHSGTDLTLDPSSAHRRIPRGAMRRWRWGRWRRRTPTASGCATPCRQATATASRCRAAAAR